ncbi:MAG: Jag N-terminal domain-containing protein [Clostridia bacterium]|nr:Jag N-terminal domain-containing protein [Clostridia bacterium]
MRTQEFTGKTTQEAIDAGLAALGVTIADVHVDVIQEGAKGLFGLFGSKPACVRLTVMEDEQEDDHGLSDLLGSFSLSDPNQKKKPQPKAAKPEAKKEAPKAEAKKEAPKAEPKKEAPKAEAKKEAPKAEPKKEAPKAEVKAEAEQEAPKAEAKKERAPKQPRPAKKERAPKAPKAEAKAEEPKEEKEYAPMTPAEPFNPTEPPVMHDEATPAGRAQRFLMDVTERMNVKVDVYVDDSKEDNLYIHMIGDTLGILIGRRGETLDALQYLTSLQVNKGRDGYIRVTLDTENYRAKREDSLRRLAQRMANRAQKTGRKVVLEPMNPYERRVLHTALQNHPAVTTHSEGEEPNRRVVIMLAGQTENSAKAERGERAERGEKPSSSRRSRSRRRGRRGSKKDGQNAPQTENAQETVVSAEAGSEE